MRALENLTTRLEGLDGLDDMTGRVADLVTRISHRPGVTGLLAGTPAGHPLHPVLTDLPIGSWTSAFFLDLMGGSSSRRASQTLVGLGVLSALPTAMTGLADWADTEGRIRRIGAVHALVNTSALVLYTLSWRSRRRGGHLAGVLWGLAGATVATGGAYLGGHLVYRTGTGVDVNAGTGGPSDWTDALSSDVVAPGVHVLRSDGVSVLATKSGERWNGIGARCSHRGGPLQEGTFAGGCVTCPWHASRFRLDDGSVVAGPATAPQPHYVVREKEGSFSVEPSHPS